VTQYRLVVWRRPRTKWCFDREALVEDAIDMGLARRSHRYGEKVYWDICVVIEQRQVSAERVIVKLATIAQAA
jgi:hypothetical protein